MATCLFVTHHSFPCAVYVLNPSRVHETDSAVYRKCVNNNIAEMFPRKKSQKVPSLQPTISKTFIGFDSYGFIPRCLPVFENKEGGRCKFHSEGNNQAKNHKQDLTCSLIIRPLPPPVLSMRIWRGKYNILQQRYTWERD